MKKQSLLWKITHRPTGRESFVFGTMHVHDLRAFAFLELAKTALERCSLFATEFQLDETDYSKLEAATRLAADRPFEKWLTPSILKKLEKRLAKNNLPNLDFWKTSHPMLLASALTDLVLKNETPLSLDETLFEHAKSSGKTCLGIESFDEQMDIFQKLPLDEQFKNLAWTVKNFGRFKRQLHRAANFYENADLTQLSKSARRSAKGLRKLLLFERNERMAERIAAFAAADSIFCAIGAGHLSGGKGVLRLLKNAGFEVKPVF